LGRGKVKVGGPCEVPIRRCLGAGEERRNGRSRHSHFLAYSFILRSLFPRLHSLALVLIWTIFYLSHPPLHSGSNCTATTARYLDLSLPTILIRATVLFRAAAAWLLPYVHWESVTFHTVHDIFTYLSASSSFLGLIACWRRNDASSRNVDNQILTYAVQYLRYCHNVAKACNTISVFETFVKNIPIPKVDKASGNEIVGAWRWLTSSRNM